MKREIKFTPAYDKTQEKPNYDGMVITFIVRGAQGAVVFSFHSGLMLAATRKWLGAYQSHPYGTELNAHSFKPHEGSELTERHCSLIDAPACHSSVLSSSATGRELAEKLISEGDAPIWAALEKEYQELFLQQELSL